MELTREEASRMRVAAAERCTIAHDALGTWGWVVALEAARGFDVSGCTDETIVRHAAHLEAAADWQEARERWQALR